jgi:Uma2 family endonuclease
MGMSLTHRSFTVDEYHRMAEAGILGEDDRVELIGGQVVAMTPIGAAHASCVNRLIALFAPLARGAATLSVQNPMVLAEYDEPQPDFTVLHYRADGYRDRHPQATDVLLVIEVADTSIEWDRQTKIPLYGRVGIPEAWLVNLPADCIECYRKPEGAGYADVRTAKRGETLTPVRLPSITLSVDDILG